METNIRQLLENLPPEVKKVPEIQDAEQHYREAVSKLRRTVEAARGAVKTPFSVTEIKKLESAGFSYRESTEDFRLFSLIVKRGASKKTFNISAEEVSFDTTQEWSLPDIIELAKDYKKARTTLFKLSNYDEGERIALHDYFKTYTEYSPPEPDLYWDCD